MKRLAVIIPAYNEEKSIADVIGGIPKNIDGIGDIQVIVVDDGSTDRTAAVAADKGAMVVSNPRNLGLGNAFRKGIHGALRLGADVIVNIDADGQFDPGDIPKLVTPVLDGKAEFVTASRFMDKKRKPKMSVWKRLGNRAMSWIISRIVGERFRDVSCGFRAYSRETALRMNLFGRFTYTQETFIDLAVKNIPILEVPVTVRGEREFGRSKVASNLIKYGFNTMKIIIMAFRDYKPLRLMSWFSLFFILGGIASGAFFMNHYIRTGYFRPHTWAGFLSGSCFLVALLLLISGVLMETFSRMRMNQERLLYYARKEHYAKEEAEELDE